MMLGLIAAIGVTTVEAIGGLALFILIPLAIGSIAYFTAPASYSSGQRWNRTILAALVLSPIVYFIAPIVWIAAATMLFGDTGPLVIRGWVPGWLGTCDLCWRNRAKRSVLFLRIDEDRQWPAFAAGGHSVARARRDCVPHL
jgi:hypothetical protein